MPNPQYNLFGKKVSDTYHSLLQSGSDGKFYDGDGNEVTINATIPDIYVKYSQTGSFATTGSNIFRGDQTVTGSLFTTGSNTLIGSTTLTGSLNVTGSTTQIGNNSLFGNTTLSGSIIISGAFGTNNPTVQIYGDTTHNGYIRFDPVTTNIDQNITASYIYVSGSTNDLYFTQNGGTYKNTTRLRWLEGNLYTGLLNGGVISQVNSNTYKVASGSGVIVNLNASYNDNPYPTIQYLNWGDLTKTIDALSASFDQQFVSIDSSSAIFAQGTPYQDGQYNTLIPLGVVVHQNHSSINAVQSFPSVGYGWKQRSYDFIKAFGPLKISGYNLAQSGSSTRGLVLSGGTAWVDGRNWIVDPNNPSYITEAVGITTSKIYRYYQSGSDWGYNTNNGAGYTDIDPTQYSLSGSLTPVSSNHWTIQRVYYFPNSATKALYVYYGNAEYANQADALAAVTTEPFSEAPNTAANAIYIGYMLLRNDASFNTAASFTIQAGGLFRGSGGGGGGGGGGTTSPGGSNTQIQYNNNGAFGGVSNLTWDGTTLSATGSFTGSFTGSLLGTASYAANGGVTQLLAGPNISLSPTNGLGQVTISSTGGGGVYGNTATGSYGSFFSTQTQNVAAINTPTSMSFNNTDITNGVSISGSANASIKIANAGVYDLQFSAQLQKQGSGGGVANVLIWLRKNNIDLAATNTYVQLPGGTNSKTVAAWNWFLNAAAGDEYRIMWSTDDTNAQLYYDPAPTVGPIVPSVIATVARVDQFLSNTGSFSGSFTGEFTGSLLGTGSWASNATTASYVLNAVSSSFAATASQATTSSISLSPIAVTGSTIYSTNPATSNISSTSGIFLGSSAGAGAVEADYSIFLGYQAGQGATSASEAVFIGPLAGSSARRANGSIFLGSGAGQNAVSASYSTLIGYYAGSTSDPLTSIGNNNIILGNNITLPSRSRDSINIGAILFATGSYSTLGAGNLYSGSVMGRVGINISTPQYNLDVSGSGNYSNGLTVTGSLVATSLTGSFSGSFAGVVLTSQTSSMLAPYVLSSQTSSFVTNSQTSSMTVLSSSFAATASFISVAQTASFVTTAQTASYVLQAVSASFATLAQNASTASFVATAQTASYVLNAISSSFATSASYALNGGVTQIIAGTNVTISPTNGLGAVTINSSGGSGGAGANITASFTNQSTWTFAHALGNRGVIVQTYDTNWNQLIPQDITLTDSNTATITFPTLESGFAVASLGGVTSIVNASSSISSSFASTASFVNTLNQSVNITGAVTASIFAATDNGNGTNFKVGDDAWIGDINTADTMQVRGQQSGGKGYIKFGTGSSNPIIGSSGTSVLEIQNGYIQMPSRPAFRVTGSTSSDITATTTLTSTQGVGVDYNQGNYYTASSGIFTAPVSGLYNTYLNVRVGSAAASKQVIVYKNNATPMLMWETTTNTGAVHFGVSGVIYLAANDNLRAIVTVGNVQFDANDSWGATYIG